MNVYNNWSIFTMMPSVSASLVDDRAHVVCGLQWTRVPLQGGSLASALWVPLTDNQIWLRTAACSVLLRGFRSVLLRSAPLLRASGQVHGQIENLLVIPRLPYARNCFRFLSSYPYLHMLGQQLDGVFVGLPRLFFCFFFPVFFFSFFFFEYSWLKKSSLCFQLPDWITKKFPLF